MIRIIPVTELDAAIAIKCKRNFTSFFIHFWETIEAGQLVMSWHIEFLCAELQKVVLCWERKEKQLDVLINLPFGLSKSTVLQLLQAWITLRNPSVKILGTSYAGRISAKNSGKVRECLKSPKFQSWYPGVVIFNKEIDGKTQFGTEAKGIYYTSSTDSAATGMHSDFIFNDDPLSAKQANSEKKRDTVNDFISNTLSSRKTEEYTVTVTVMQRLHLEDPAGMLLAKKQLNHINLPARVDAHNRSLVKPVVALSYYDAHDGYLNPVRFGEAKIAEYKGELSHFAYAAQVMQNPADDSTGLIKKDDFEIINWQQFLAVTAGSNVVWNFDADTALTANRANDPTALLASCVVKGTTYIRESYSCWMEQDDLVAFLPEFLKRNGATTTSTLYVEPKANGKPIVNTLSRSGNILVEEAPNPTSDKVQRLHNVLPEINKYNVKLIDGHWIVAFLQELTAFPNGKHDDRVDTLTQCLARLTVPAKKKPIIY
ncbi:phage terminase large subunit [Hymenobacter sp. APR13]|uniref:phage terminase large subunit n=1 Tax=Hymenobacter sp. APR13 TaxID=1356852 RepID=UPI0004E03242|nr:phage terminase large subunit [Hymenobacter sp. APR13]AII50374.1 hypothetical protein N008_00040 [Hymenobacter sp. APR13]